MHASKLICAVALSLTVASGAHAIGIVRLDTVSDFAANPGVIEFDEVPVGTTNPFYTPVDYGGDAGAPEVTFDGYFSGQGVQADCPTANISACVTGEPDAPLALDTAAPETRTFNDIATSERVLVGGRPAGDPLAQLEGPIAMRFSLAQVAVGFDAGFFNAARSTRVRAYAADGTLLGVLLNEAMGSMTGSTEFFGIATDDGSASIAGLLLDLVAQEDFGFAIDNLRFGVAASSVPAPLAAVLVLSGLALVLLTRR